MILNYFAIMRFPKVIILVAVIVICAIAISLMRGYSLDESEARDVARKELIDFAMERDLDIDLFSDLKVIEMNTPWGFSWEYKGQPRLEGGVNILNDGTAEIYFSPIEN